MESRPFSRVFPFELIDVFHFVAHQDQIAWEPYKKGVDIFRLYGDGISGPTAALVRYREHGEVPCMNTEDTSIFWSCPARSRMKMGYSKQEPW